MAATILQDLRAEATGTSENAPVAVSWNGEGYRHHFWMRDYNREAKCAAEYGQDGKPLDFTIYRNLPEGHPDARGFRTRHLSTAKGYGAKVLAIVVPQLPALLEAAELERQQNAAAEAVEQRAQMRIHLAREAGPDLLAVVIKLVEGKGCQFDALNPCWNNRPTDVPGKHWGVGDACPVCTARALIAKIERPAAAQATGAPADAREGVPA